MSTPHEKSSGVISVFNTPDIAIRLFWSTLALFCLQVFGALLLKNLYLLFVSAEEARYFAPIASWRRTLEDATRFTTIVTVILSVPVAYLAANAEIRRYKALWFLLASAGILFVEMVYVYVIYKHLSSPDLVDIFFSVVAPWACMLVSRMVKWAQGKTLS